VKYDEKFASRWRAKSPDALCAVLPKVFVRLWGLSKNRPAGQTKSIHI